MHTTRLIKLMLIAAKLVMLLAGALHAEIVKLRCVVGRQCTPLACSTVYAYGSGVTFGELRDGRVAVLTCSHVIRGASSVSLFWHNQAVVPCQVLADGGPDGLDVALLAARLEPAPTDCKPLLADKPANDAEVWVCGFPGSRSYSVLRGTLFGTSLRVRERIEQGMSGGGVFTRDGLAGIVWGCEAYQPCNGEYTPSWLIRTWLIKRIGYVPECGSDQRQDRESANDSQRAERERDNRPPSPSAAGSDDRSSSLSRGQDPAAGELRVIAERIERIEQRIRSVEESHSRWKSQIAEGCKCDHDDLLSALDRLSSSVLRMQSDIERLKQVSFPVRTLKPDGSIFSEEIVKLGDPIELRLVPRKPQP